MTLDVEQNHYRNITGPFSLREKVRMRGINQEACIDIDPLTLALSLWERANSQFKVSFG